jgi:hypothetical protein
MGYLSAYDEDVTLVVDERSRVAVLHARFPGCQVDVGYTATSAGGGPGYSYSEGSAAGQACRAPLVSSSASAYSNR